MNPKIDKLRKERGKNDTKISELQTRNKEIDAQIIELENTDIIGLVRAAGMTLEQFVQMMSAMKDKPLPETADSVYETEDDPHEN